MFGVSANLNVNQETRMFGIDRMIETHIRSHFGPRNHLQSATQLRASRHEFPLVYES